ncbi:MAG: PqqD family protein [Nannocystaceae bacterium]
MSTYEINTPTVISEVFAGETVVLDFDTGRYYSFNPSATKVWDALDGGTRVDALACAAGVDTETVRDFLSRLHGEGLVRRKDDECAETRVAAEQAGTRAPSPPPAFDSPLPAFERFDDLENLLLLDPIHDVSAEGWPKTREVAKD